VYSGQLITRIRELSKLSNKSQFGDCAHPPFDIKCFLVGISQDATGHVHSSWTVDFGH
jgi:hypothetical protein